MIESQHVDPRNAVIQGQCTVPIVIIGTGILAGLFAGAVQRMFLTKPVVFVAGSIHIRSGIAIVVGCQHHIQPLDYQVAFAVFHRRHQ